MNDGLPPLPAGAEPIETPALPPGAVPMPSTGMPPAEKKPSLFERGTEVAKAGGMGALAGTFAPEIMTGVGAGMMAFPPTAPFGPFVMGAGRAMRGARMAGALSGGLGGVIGETGGQAVEAGGGPPAAAEAARFAGGMVGPEGVRAVTSPLAKVGGYGLSTLINRAVPTLGTSARTIGQLLGERGTAEAGPSLTQEQARFIQDKLASIRGGAPSFQPMKDIMGIFRQAAQKEVQTAESLASNLERQADAEIQRATATGAQITGEATQRISRLQSQLNSAADSIRSRAQQQSDIIKQQAEAAAQAVRQRAAQQAPGMREGAEAEAQAIIQSGREQADQLATEARARIYRLQKTSERLRSSIPGRAEAAGKEVAAVGERTTPTQLGEKLRSGFEEVFSKLRATRQANAEKYKGEAFGAALAKEKSGQFAEDTPAFQKAMQSIENEIRNPETGLQATIQPVREQLRKIVNELKPFKVTVNPEGQEVIVREKASFERLEQLRRFLRDRASGLPAEGYDAIGQQQAGRLADLVEEIQRDFSPGFGKFLEQYKADSLPLNQFKNKLGQAMVGRQEFDFSQFAADPAALAGQAFKTASTVNQLTQTIGKEQTEALARSYIADLIRGGKAADIKKAIDTSRDWIGQFPALAQQLEQAAQRVGVAERVAGKRSELAKKLRTEMGTIPTELGRRMTRVEEDAAKAAAAKVAAGEKAATKVTTEAEKEATKALTEAEKKATGAVTGAEADIGAAAKKVEGRVGELRTEAEKLAAGELTAAQKAAGGLTKEAEKLRKEAQDKANLILAGKTDVERVSGFLLGSKADEWRVLTDIIKNAPGGKEKLADAVGQTIAMRAEQSLKGAIQDMKLMGDKLIDAGLMSKSEVDKLVGKLEEIFVAPIDTKTRTTLAQRLVRNALAGYVAPGIERGGEAAYKALTEKK